MRIVKDGGSFKVLAIMTGLDGESPLQLIEHAGRTAYQSHQREGQGTAEKFVRMISERGHGSVLEHSAMTVRFDDVSRGFTHDIVRHRHTAYTQESTIYVDESDFVVTLPHNRDENERLIELDIPSLPAPVFVSTAEWLEMNQQAYRSLRKGGWAPREARQVLPTAIKAQIVLTTNFREWRSIFQLRTNDAGAWEIRRIMKRLLEHVKTLVPVVFDDIEVKEER